MKLRFFLLAMVFIAVFFVLQQLFMPKYMSGIYEGALIAEYYEEPKNHEVFIIGDCEVYENISPVTLFNQYGITSYIRGSAQQLVWQSYYLLEEMLAYEKPKVVIFSVLALKYNEPQNEAYNRLTLDGMRLSLSKINAIYASIMPQEAVISYIFPLLRYHDRWREISADDFIYFWRREPISHNGFMMRSDIRPVTTIPTGVKLPDYRFGDNSYYYLDKITQLCAENDIALMLIKAPSVYPYWYAEWDSQMQAYAAEHHIQYVNLLDLADEIGIDFAVDTYDAGLHLNVSGAEKVSVYLGNILSETYALTDFRNDAETARRWAEKTAKYDRMKAAQQQEFAEYGVIKSFFVH